MEQEVRCGACGLRYELRNRSVVEIELPSSPAPLDGGRSDVERSAGY